MAPMPVTLNHLEGHSPVAELFKCNSSTRFQMVQCVARSLGDSWASCIICFTLYAIAMGAHNYCMLLCQQTHKTHLNYHLIPAQR